MDPARHDGSWEDLFWALFRSSPNPIVVVDEGRIIRAANDAALALFGATREELIDTPAESRVTPDERIAGAQVWERLLRTGEVSGTRTFTRSDGGAVRVNHRSRLMRIQGRAYVVTVVQPSGAEETRRTRPAAGGALLSEREREVVALITVGRNTEQIADELHISSATVRSHVGNAMERLGVHTRAHLVWVAVRDGLLVPSVGSASIDGRPDPPQPAVLRERERVVVTLIALGQHTEEIARSLQISPATVRTHVRNAMEKLGAHTRAQVVWVALSYGLIDPHMTEAQSTPVEVRDLNSSDTSAEMNRP